MTTDKKIKSPFDAYKKYEDLVSACNRCGFCTSYCPTYNATGSEAQSPRGRNQAFRALLEGKLTDPDQAREIVDTCLLCGECTSVCFAEVPTADIMIQARDLINHTHGLPPFLQYGLKNILSKPNVFRFVLKTAFFLKKIKVVALANKMGLLRRISPKLETANALVDTLPLTFLLDHEDVKTHLSSARATIEQRVMMAQFETEQLKKSGKKVSDQLLKTAQEKLPRASVAYFPMCGSQYIRPSIGLSTFFLFEQLGLDYVIPDVLCCGLPAASYGVTDQVRSMAVQNMQALQQKSFDFIVADDSSCVGHVKDYPKYFGNDVDHLRQAHALNQKVRDLSSFLVYHHFQDVLKKKAAWSGDLVAYHDPCKAQYGQKNTKAPRELLSVIPGIRMTPVPDADQCCGGGGTYSFVHPDISQSVLDAKVKNIVSTGAKIIVTSSTSCLIQLAAGLKKTNPEIEVLHLSEFLARALKTGK